MKLIAYGDIMSGGTSVFISTTRVDGGKLCVSFSGAIRIDNPHLHLQTYIDELDAQLAKLNVRETELDFTELRFCNSNGFYVIMDIAELVYRSTKGPVGVLRLSSDDWQQETLPILIDIEEPIVGARTIFRERQEL